MKKAFFLVVIAAGIGAAVAVFVNQKQKFAGMSEEDIRSYLDQKLGGRMSEDQVKQIQDAVVSAVKGASAASDKVKDVASNASDTAAGVAGDAKEKIDDVVDKAKDAVGKAKDASDDAAEAAEEAVEAVEEAVDES
jgi:ElaB/YqjD/DUF883 family membrane-anchored ribosome-binding protein